MARIAGGSSDIERRVERKVREPQVANDPPWSYIIDDDKKQDAPIVVSDDEDDDVVIISETHTPKGRRHVSTVPKRRSPYQTDFKLTNFGFTRPRVAKICRVTRDEVPPLLTKISYTTTSTNSTLVQSGFAQESSIILLMLVPGSATGAAVQASSTATLAPHTIVCALTSKLSPNGTPVNSQHATTHPTTLGITWDY
ncbi:hypothetical protein M438DRAFT_358855 [Aureobasidium pullulans EXF-150]|uniref:Uncharacterized protein n=1 Tax=Aureobasidium pullulans EXF-150 TaxID=1043002 RepID=A0A074Y0H0_AURPU|nr:uncharacterized protein M438DRAFT_358855 [Aureobasidium pullulans EXF-150]KEQ80406.1 hypothetical protein M438DRAFT_358855 [Aureobasidium pullulans EXF-150]